VNYEDYTPNYYIFESIVTRNFYSPLIQQVKNLCFST